MDSNTRIIGRRERREIIKSIQGVGEGTVAVDKGPVEPLRPNAILRTLENGVARRQGPIWPAFTGFWVKPG
jgi:hypothetical protein